MPPPRLPIPATAGTLHRTLLLYLIPLLALFSSTSLALSSTTTITLSVPASPQLPNPATLPPTTHATLTSLGVSLSAPLTASNTFVFRNVSAGSYLCDVDGPTYAFAPLRVDVSFYPPPASQSKESTQAPPTSQAVSVRVWETFRGNDWDNKGEEIKPVVVEELGNGGAASSFPVKLLGQKVYYTERGSFSVLSILKNPMILMGLVSLALFVGMPKLVENMDAETRAEFEEQSKNNPMNSLMGGSQAGGSGMGNFDVAGFLAGQGNKDAAPEAGSGSGSGNGGKKAGKR